MWILPFNWLNCQTVLTKGKCELSTSILYSLLVGSKCNLANTTFSNWHAFSVVIDYIP